MVDGQDPTGDRRTVNPKPIEAAKDPALRGSLAAMHRAAQRAREVAIRTGTRLVMVRDGRLTYVDPATYAEIRGDDLTGDGDSP